MKSISHPNVMAILASSLDREPYYYVSKFCKHHLADYLSGGTRKLSHAERLELFAKICDGVQAAHAKGVIHRDIKPLNVLVEKSGNPRVCDFGICFVPGGERHTGTEEQMGPRKYMAPELRDGRVEDGESITTRADVYSLGKLLYTMFLPSGPLFDREQFRDDRFNVVTLTGREELQHVNQIFERTIQEDPAKRFVTAGGLAIEVRKISPLVTGNYLIVDPVGDQRCTVCGRGRYKVDHEFATVNRVNGIQMKVLNCDSCGHTLQFRPATPEARKTWRIE